MLIIYCIFVPYTHSQSNIWPSQIRKKGYLLSGEEMTPPDREEEIQTGLLTTHDYSILPCNNVQRTCIL